MSYRLPAPPPPAEQCLPGRDTTMPVRDTHAVLGTPLRAPWPEGMDTLIVGMGCFWGAERLFWQLPGVYTTSVGYSGGYTPNPTYEETCTSMTGHTEAVLIVFDPEQVSLDDLLAAFWENPRPDAGRGAGQRHRQSAPVGHLHQLRRAARRDRGQSRPVPGEPGQGRRRDNHNRGRPGRTSSSTPRTTPSSTWQRTPVATAITASANSPTRDPTDFW